MPGLSSTNLLPLIILIMTFSGLLVLNIDPAGAQSRFDSGDDTDDSSGGGFDSGDTSDNSDSGDSSGSDSWQDPDDFDSGGNDLSGSDDTSDSSTGSSSEDTQDSDRFDSGDEEDDSGGSENQRDSEEDQNDSDESDSDRFESGDSEDDSNEGSEFDSGDGSDDSNSNSDRFDSGDGEEDQSDDGSRFDSGDDQEDANTGDDQQDEQSEESNEGNEGGEDSSDDESQEDSQEDESGDEDTEEGGDEDDNSENEGDPDQSNEDSTESPDDSGSSGSYIEIDPLEVFREDMFVRVSPSTVGPGEQVSVSGGVNVEGVQGKSASLYLNNRELESFRLDDNGEFSTTISSLEKGRNTVGFSFLSVSKSTSFDVVSDLSIFRTVTSGEMSPGETIEVCSDIRSSTDATIRFYADGSLEGSKVSKGRTCFNTVLQEGTNTFEIRASAGGKTVSDTVERTTNGFTASGSSIGEFGYSTGGFAATSPSLDFPEFNGGVIGLKWLFSILASLAISGFILR